MSILTPDRSLTGLGYALCITAAVVCWLGASFVGKSSHQKLSAKQLVFCGTAMALGFLTSYIRLFKLPWGGSVTLCSMLFVCLIGYWYGLKTGIMTGLAYGILQFLQEPYVLSLFQVCCDYVFAFAALGLAGAFCKSKNGLVLGFLLAVLTRGVFHSIGGYLYWMSYMPDNFPKSMTVLYPILYNYSYLLAEAALTIIVIKLPTMKKALDQLSRMAKA